MAEQISLITRVSMSLPGFAKVRYGHTVLDMAIDGTSADALESLIREHRVQPAELPAGSALVPMAFIGRGRFFTSAEVAAEARVAVLGYQTALDLFGPEEPVGQTIWIARQRFLVTGVLTELESTSAEPLAQVMILMCA